LHAALVRRLKELRERAADARPRTEAALAEARRLADTGGASTETLRTLVEAMDDARRLGEEKSRLLADVSHDLKQPLLVLQMSVEMLERHLPEKAGRRELERIERTIARMQEALEALQSAARLDLAAPSAAGGGGSRGA
jgi:signal transduction histidine kinase